MKRRDFLRGGTSLVLAPALLLCRGLAQGASPALSLPVPGADGWVSLLNGRDLTGWYSVLEKSGKGFAEFVRRRGRLQFVGYGRFEVRL